MIIRIGFDNLIQQGSTIIIISCCIHISIRLRNRCHTQPRQPIGINGKTSRGQKARGSSRIDGWITLMKWRGKIVQEDKITTNKRMEESYSKADPKWLAEASEWALVVHTWPIHGIPPKWCSRWRAKEQRRIFHCENLRNTTLFPWAWEILLTFYLSLSLSALYLV